MIKIIIILAIIIAIIVSFNYLFSYYPLETIIILGALLIIIVIKWLIDLE